jgi:hypothetical protein
MKFELHDRSGWGWDVIGPPTTDAKGYTDGGYPIAPVCNAEAATRYAALRNAGASHDDAYHQMRKVGCHDRDCNGMHS